MSWSSSASPATWPGDDLSGPVPPGEEEPPRLPDRGRRRRPLERGRPRADVDTFAGGGWAASRRPSASGRCCGADGQEETVTSHGPPVSQRTLVRIRGGASLEPIQLGRLRRRVDRLQRSGGRACGGPCDGLAGGSRPRGAGRIRLDRRAAGSPGFVSAVRARLPATAGRDPPSMRPGAGRSDAPSRRSGRGRCRHVMYPPAELDRMVSTFSTAAFGAEVAA
jgi:hypothetical protein